jgi:hypothetical protein
VGVRGGGAEFPDAAVEVGSPVPVEAVMTATYVLLRIESESQADDLLSDMREVVGGQLLTPTYENPVGAEVVVAYRDGVPYQPEVRR